MKRIVLVVLSAVLGLSPLLAGGNQEPKSQSAQSAQATQDPVKLAINLAERATKGQSANYTGTSGITVAIIMPQLDNPGFRGMYIGSLTEAIKLGASLITLDAQNKVDTEMGMIEDMITKKVNALVLVPVDSSAISAGVKEANKAGIPVVTMDRSTEAGNVTALVESNNVAIGTTGADLMQQAAKAQNKPISGLKVLELLGDMTTSAAVERHQGFADEATKLGLNVIAQGSTYWDPAKANAAVLDAFQAHPDINAIYMASGCAMYSGVAPALKSLNKLIPRGTDGHIILISSDGCQGPMDGIRQAYVDGDAAHQMLRIGAMAVEIAFNAAKGVQPQDSVIKMTPDTVTPENVDSKDHWANVLKVQ